MDLPTQLDHLTHRHRDLLRDGRQLVRALVGDPLHAEVEALLGRVQHHIGREEQLLYPSLLRLWQADPTASSLARAAVAAIRAEHARLAAADASLRTILTPSTTEGRAVEVWLDDLRAHRDLEDRVVLTQVSAMLKRGDGMLDHT